MRRDLILMIICGAEEPADTNTGTRETYEAERTQGDINTLHVYS